MSRRPIRDKQVAQLRKALRRTPPAFIDLVDWLQSRGHAQTAGAARRLILDGRVRKGSHKLGIVKVNATLPDGSPTTRDSVYPFIPASYRADLIVLAAE